MKRPRRRLFVGGCSLICLSFLGCMNVPFYIPEVNTIPPVELGSANNDTHIFRVDVAQRIAMDAGAADAHGEPKAVETDELTEIAADAPGTTPRQVGITCRQGWRTIGLWNFSSDCLSHTIALRLYRPGFETIEVPCGKVPHAVHWTKATDLAAQEKAVDTLLGVALLEPSDSTPGVLAVQRKLEPGTTSDAQRDALLFGVHEYERLARRAAREGDDPDARQRLLDKATRLHAVAEGEAETAP